MRQVSSTLSLFINLERGNPTHRFTFVALPNPQARVFHMRKTYKTDNDGGRTSKIMLPFALICQTCNMLAQAAKASTAGHRKLFGYFV